MSGKLAISYYWSMSGELTGVQIHQSGVEAVEEIQNAAGQLFNMPYIKKNRMRLTKGHSVSIGYGHRGLVARFLEDDEVALYKKWGDKCKIKVATRHLCEPDEVNK